MDVLTVIITIRKNRKTKNAKTPKTPNKINKSNPINPPAHPADPRLPTLTRPPGSLLADKEHAGYPDLYIDWLASQFESGLEYLVFGN